MPARLLMMLLLGLFGLFALPAGVAAAQDDLALPDDPLANPDRWLDESRWSELRYGLSIREPKDAKRDFDTPQGDAVRWALPERTRIRLSFARGVYETVDANGRVVRLPAKVDLLKKQLSDELKASVAGQVINTRADQVIEVGELVGIINYYVIKPAKPGAQPFLKGVALLQLDELSVAVLRIECTPDQVVPATSTFECMAQSIRVQTVSEVNERINGWIQNSEQLLADLTQQDRLDAMRPDALYRVLEQGEDIGYLRVWQRYQDKAFYQQRKAQDKADGGDGRLGGVYRFETPGNAVVIQSHYKGNGATIDRLFEAIDADASNSGYWQIKTTMGFAKQPKKRNRFAGTWVETGVRGTLNIAGKPTDHLQITREGTPPRHMVDFLLQREKDPERKLRYPSADPRAAPAGNMVEKKFAVPRRAFLSVVDAELMPALLPREAKTYAFGAYDPERFKIDIRTMRVEPTSNDGKRVYLRPVIDQSPQVLTFDRNNNLVSWTYPDGRELRKTTRQELARVWGVRLRD